jgi:hypothetical protein
MEISAQVVLRAKGPITAATLAANQPPKDAVEAASKLFREAGFKLGPYVGISFSISGSRSLFEKFFGTRLDKLQGYELPLDSLPKDAVALIEAVTFTPPPDFGPSGSGP